MSSLSNLILSSLSGDVFQQLSKPTVETRGEVVVDVPTYQTIFEESGLDIFWNGATLTHEKFREKYINLKSSQVRRIFEEELCQNHRSDFDSLQAKVIQARNNLFPLTSDETNTLINFTSEIDEKISALSEKDLITTFQKACECGDSEIVQKILATKRLETVGDTNARDMMLGASFKEAGTKGYIEIIHAMKESPFFAQIPGYILGETLVAAGQNGYGDVMMEIIESGRLRDIADGKINEAFKEAVTHGLVEVVRKWIASPLISISRESLSWALQRGVELNQLEIVQAILASSEILDVFDFKIALGEAASRGHIDIVNAFITSTLFDLIIDCPYESALELAASFGHIDIINAFIASTRFNRDVVDLGVALIRATEGGYIDIVNVLIASTHFNKIRAEDLRRALRKATEGGHVDIVSALVTSTRFNEIRALEEAAKGGHTNGVNTPSTASNRLAQHSSCIIA